ncbi:LytR/AlgR family response regulator transcription factor [Lysobacter sp. A3-1-A15]|uniref:LytR/AlgR family response regulator transcription factor n=1 Tax=Novilysobacter viscosus TaxID=3098602 RepID=UPI002EDBAD58
MIRALIVDDERLARVELRRLLQVHPGVEIVGEATEVVEAGRKVRELQPDVVFLDVEMPGDSGLTFARTLTDATRVVFCTAHSAFAAEAFELNAVDYLMKPVSPESLARAVGRLGACERPEVEHLPMDFAVMLKFDDVSRVVRLGEIERFESAGNYVAVHCRFGAALLVGTITRLEGRLHPKYFLRANRGEILRIDAIRDVESEVGGGLVATMESGAKCEISRRQAQSMRAQMAVL